MEQNIENKLEIKDKLIDFFNKNKLKIYLFIALLIILFVSLVLFQKNLNKKNILIADKYVAANTFLNSNKNDKALKIYDEIILSKNHFYSILALNTVIEKELISDKNKILEYFEILEKTISEKENRDLFELKKALYFMKESEFEKSDLILNKLINENSLLKPLAEEIIKK